MAKQKMAVGVVSLAMWAACCAAGQNPTLSLPDAPQVQGEVFTAESTFADPIAKSATLQYVDVARQRDFGAPNESGLNQRSSGTIFEKYLRTSPMRQRSMDSESDGGSLVSRATQAASRIFLTKDDSGKNRLNTSYFLRALTAVAASTASRPYWRRSAAEPFSNFGSTVGSDAGMNVLHEFEPGLQNLFKNHAPKFAARIAERITHN